MSGPRYCRCGCDGRVDWPKLWLAGHNNTLSTRLWARVAVGSEDECWPWTGATIKNGYGVIGKGSSDGGDRGNILTHVAAYLDKVGPIPDGYQIDHLCRSTSCCNPNHLEAVTQHENLRRQAAAMAAQRTHCRNGHEYTPDNTARQATGARRCRECSRISARLNKRRYRLAKKAA